MCDGITWKSNDDFSLYGAILNIQHSLFPPSCAKNTSATPHERLPHQVLSKLLFLGPIKINVWEAQHKIVSVPFLDAVFISTSWTVESDVRPSILGSKNPILMNKNKKQTWQLN